MDATLRAIVERASAIHERVGAGLLASEDPNADPQRDARMRAWQREAARDDEAAFALRLSWDGLDPTSARRAVGPVRLAADAPLPSWATVLAQVLALAPASAHAAPDRSCDAGQPVPFEEVLCPFVVWARARCEQLAGAAYRGVRDSAHVGLERQLLETLAVQSARALALELSVALAEQHGALDALLPGAPPRDGYAAFVAGLLDRGLPAFFLEYASLARVLATATELWVAATVELLQRLADDAGAIRTAFDLREPLDVVAVEPALSDPHHGQRSVAILICADGARVVYKPRDLAIEVGWNALLAWLAHDAAPVALRSLRVLPREGYGWVEHVSHAPCRDGAEVDRYFERGGALLCLVHLLNGTDCHAGNLVFAGEHPILIDVETLLTPETPQDASGSRAVQQARRQLTSSVLATYLLPIWSSSLQNGEVFDGSGLGADVEQARNMTAPRWVHVNTDRMTLARVPVDDAPPAPTLDGRGLRVHEHEGAVLRGFSAMYRFLLARRDALRAADGPLQLLAGTTVRFVHRNTSVYSATLERLRGPELLRDGADRSLGLEPLALVALIGELFDVRPGWRELWNAERAALERGDVPHFGIRAGSRDLALGGGRVLPGWFTHSGHEVALQRLALAGERDLAFQCDLICSALRSRAPQAEDPILQLNDATDPATTSTTAADRARFVAEAEAIADSLVRAAIVGDDGSAAWLQPAWSREQMIASPRREMMVAGHDLYDGALGIGLFLAASARVTGRADLRALALAAVQPLQLELVRRGGPLAQELGLGGLSGLGSVAYGLVQLAGLLQEPELLHAAERAAALITSERIAADRALDLSAGAAGALLGLLALHRARPEAGALERARACAEHLLGQLEPCAGGHAIRSLHGRALCGITHGAAGFAYALHQLHEVTREQRLLDAAAELLAFERNAFSAQQRDWPDLRDSGALRFTPSWCNGAPGIALARLGLRPTFDDERTRAEIERGLEITAAPLARNADTLCCGSFGRVATLASAGRRLARSDLQVRAHGLALQLIARAASHGGYALGLPSVGKLHSRGLFQGSSGVGYTLLQLAEPGLLPEPLLLA